MSYKTVAIKLHDMSIVFPLSQNVVTKFNAEDLMFKRVTVEGVYKETMVIARRIHAEPTNFVTRILWFFDSLRQSVIRVCFSILPAEEAGILIGILLGDSTHVSHNMYEAFKKTGTLHLFAASGMNLVLFGGFFREVLVLFTKRKKAEVLALFSCIFYIFLSGFQPSILRAGVMSICAGFTSVAGRPLKSSLNLLYAVGILLFINPDLIFNLGFQLSVLATLGLIINPGSLVIPASSHVVPAGIRKRANLPVGQRVIRVIGPIWRMLAADLKTSFSCFLFTAPLLIFTFGQINFLSIIVNFTVLWTIDILMLEGMIMVLLYFIGLRIETIFTLLLFPVITYFKSMILYFSRLNVGVINLNYPDKIVIFTIFCLILWLVFLFKTEEKASCQNNLYIKKHQ